MFVSISSSLVFYNPRVHIRSKSTPTHKELDNRASSSEHVKSSRSGVLTITYEACGSVNSTEILARHFITFQPPDLIVSAPQKQVTSDEAAVIWQFVNDSTANVERFYWIADISNLERAPAGTPQRDQMRSLLRLHGLACVKGSFAQRTIMNVAARASRLLGYSDRDGHIGFFDDETSARAWVDSLRKEAKQSSQ